VPFGFVASQNNPSAQLGLLRVSSQETPKAPEGALVWHEKAVALVGQQVCPSGHACGFVRQSLPALGAGVEPNVEEHDAAAQSARSEAQKRRRLDMVNFPAFPLRRAASTSRDVKRSTVAMARMDRVHSRRSQ
jgi:hypothetical protein